MAASNSNHRGTSVAGIQLGSAWFQRKINLRPQHRGVHLVTEEILRQMPELGQFSVGLCHVQSKNLFIFFITFSTTSKSVLCHFLLSFNTTYATMRILVCYTFFSFISLTLLLAAATSPLFLLIFLI
jgi:hypothetical protein